MTNMSREIKHRGGGLRIGLGWVRGERKGMHEEMGNKDMKERGVGGKREGEVGGEQ